MRGEKLQKPLRRFRETNDGADIYGDCRDESRGGKDTQSRAESIPAFVHKCYVESDENSIGEDLECQTSQQNVVRTIRVFPVGIRGADESSAQDLDDGGDDIADDERPQNESRSNGCVFVSDSVDHRRQEGIDGGRVEDRRDHNAEILAHEVRHCVRVEFRGQDAEDVAHDFHRRAD